MADINNNNDVKKDIIDNLLIKEEAGNLHYFQDKSSTLAKQSLANVGSNTPVIDNDADKDVDTQEIINKQLNQISTAPKDDSFSHTLPSQAGAKEKSELIFHPEDKEQLDRLSESVPVDDSKKYSIEKIIEKLLTKQNLKLDTANEALFTNLILDFFRNRRSVIASRELMATKVIFEEKTLSTDVVDNILSVIKSLKNKIDGEGGLVVDAERMKKEPVKVTPIVEIKKGESTLKTNIEQGKPESNIFTKNVQAKEREDNKIEDFKEEPKIDGVDAVKNLTQDKEDNLSVKNSSEDKEVPLGGDQEAKFASVSTTVKFGIQPKGMNEEESIGNPEIGKETKAELDESLADLKSIIPNMATDNSEEKEEEKLLKELSLDNVADTEVPKQDLHDIGQLITTEDNDTKKDEEDAPETEGFAIKKIKPSNVILASTVENKEKKKEDKNNKEDKNIDHDDNLEQESLNINKSNEEEVPKEDAKSLPRVIRPEQTFSIKPKISDIQQVASDGSQVRHVLTGPVDELRSMTLRNFRFLGTNVEDRKNKILEKISILEQDSYTKKAAGIKAWRESPVNKLYLNLGAESMTLGKDMTVLINEKKVAGEETLEMEEFSSISDLNKDLRF